MIKDEKLEARQNDYRKCKYGILQQREKVSMSLRKKQISEIILDKRLKKSESSKLKLAPGLTSIQSKLFLENKKLFVENIESEVDTLFKMLDSLNKDEVKYAIYLIREYFSCDEIVNLNVFTERGIIDIFLNILKQEQTKEDTTLIFEIYWALTNISYIGGYQENKSLTSEEFLRIHETILNYNNIDIVEQTIWLLTNIICEHTDFRNIIISTGLIDRIIVTIIIALDNKMLKFVRTCVHFLYKIFTTDKIPIELIDIITKIFPVFSSLINLEDEDIFSDCIWGLSLISDYDYPNDPHKIPKMFIGNNTNILNRILSVNYSMCKKDLPPAIRILGNLLAVENDNSFINTIIDFEVLDFFDTILAKETNKTIKRETLWAISNCLDGPYEHVILVVRSDLFCKIIKLTSDHDYSVKKEAVNALYSICSHAKFHLSSNLMRKGLYECLIELLDNKNDAEIIALALGCLESVLISGQCTVGLTQINAMAKKFEDFGGTSALEKLLGHFNNTIYKKASAIYKKYFERANETENFKNEKVINVINNFGGTGSNNINLSNGDFNNFTLKSSSPFNNLQNGNNNINIPGFPFNYGLNFNNYGNTNINIYINNNGGVSSLGSNNNILNNNPFNYNFNNDSTDRK